MTRIECLVDAFAAMNGMLDPKSTAYKLRNPLLLKAFTPKHTKDEETGLRIFSNFASGYDNGIIDVKIKCSGNSKFKLTSESTLLDLVQCYGNPPSAVRYIKNFLRHALSNDEIYENTKLSFFLADKEPDAEQT